MLPEKNNIPESDEVLDDVSVDIARLKILIVDDEVTNRMVLNAMLKKDGFTVLMAENGKQAIEVFNKENPDLILMDVMMPVMDGYEATRSIKSLVGDRFVPIFFLTAMTDEKALAKCIESGGDDFLTKPFSRTILRSKIDALLRVKKIYTTLQEQHAELVYHQQYIEREHEIAERIFKRIIRSDTLNVSNIKYLLSPVALFNGDILLVSPKPKGGQHIMLGDFTGHGLSAAIGAMPVAEIFYSMTEKGYSIQDIATEINAKLHKTLPTGLFCAACIVDVDIENNKISVWNGGVPEAIAYSAKKEIKKIFKSIHLPFGVVSSNSFKNDIQIMDAEPGDRIYLYSDGLIEATDENGVMFGEDRLDLCFANNTDPAVMFEDISNSLNNFRGNKKQDDDTTLIEVSFDNNLVSNKSSYKKNSDVKEPCKWSVSFELGPEILKDMDPLPAILHVLLEVQGLYSHRGRLYTILAELYSNALEHGVLGMDSTLKTSPEGFAEYYETRQKRLETLDNGFIRINLTHEPVDGGGKLSIEYLDSGKGFDFGSYQEQKKSNVFSGRGIALVKSLCSELKYNESGNGIKAVYFWES
ncbi:MAG: SpoIIE family protein phosphatase [Gammaproteobacteria bacterium]|nr:SpoIIE family protein phosphatase [Gammaproteobacteria bacterium]MDH5593626.1 SpoIIE family protein phosphatase [Gammaproteobacteria bacterium]